MTTKPLPEITDFNEPYFAGTALGELRIRKCVRCDTRFRFNHYLCPSCWSDQLTWEVASGRGRITHFCVIHHAPYPSFEDVCPYVIVLVELEEGVRMMSNLVGCSPEAARIGTPVQVTFEQRGPVTLPMFALAR
jgi:uncharacterized OB-fold protein